MDSGHYTSPSSRVQTSVPPLSPITDLGILQHMDGTQVKVDIHGNIDKGFFQSDGDWTCYRRNYFSCICSFSLNPHYPGQSLQFTQQGSTQSYSVRGFAMSISAVVAENDSHTIELVQHTPKRDKGPVEKPGKVHLHPKHPQMSHPMGIYHPDTVLGGPSRIGFSENATYGGQQSGDPYQTEHTFERIQFKQATANNGKRRAAQQYYHLLIELWADVGSQVPDKFIRVAYRKSAKMIVRGRSPGHYQSERRASTSSGPGGSGGSFTGYPNSSIMGSDFGPAGAMLGGGYGASFDSRGNAPYGSTRHHHELEHMLPPRTPKLSIRQRNTSITPAPCTTGPIREEEWTCLPTIGMGKTTWYRMSGQTTTHSTTESSAIPRYCQVSSSLEHSCRIKGAAPLRSGVNVTNMT
ncbi:NDT80/PhoG like DNA-binding family protein [Colletotrichum higginsianum]|nr:NDT80/PhoG like DNA-binding family protein [Colletotrichum higginsianum]